ncbi:MAG: hypothetical protein MRZ79_21455 [Bacteroidia bacterium]|nr:hypothetical protein [Bacteroidia bacterium]
MDFILLQDMDKAAYLNSWAELARIFLPYLLIRFTLQRDSWVNKKKEKIIWILLEALVIGISTWILWGRMEELQTIWVIPIMTVVYSLVEKWRLSVEEKYEKTEKKHDDAKEKYEDKLKDEKANKEEIQEVSSLVEALGNETSKRYRRKTWVILTGILICIVVLTSYWILSDLARQNSQEVNLKVLKDSFSFIHKSEFWLLALGYFIIWGPTGYIMKIITIPWQRELPKKNKGLPNAGRWIGILERTLVLSFVLINSVSAIGLLIAAKSVLRFGEIKEADNRKEAEYILIGTLLSFTIAIAVGIWLNATVGDTIKDILEGKGF